MGPDHIHEAISLGQEALKLVAIISAPPLLTALLVGVVVSVMQTATQIQEMTLTFIPKIVAVLACFFLLLPWMLQKIIHYTQELFTMMSFGFTTVS